MLKQEPVLGEFDTRNYVAEFRFVPARDGARVPVTLLHRKGTRLDGTAPMYQYAYGSYGLSTDPTNMASSSRSHLATNRR